MLRIGILYVFVALASGAAFATSHVIDTTASNVELTVWLNDVPIQTVRPNQSSTSTHVNMWLKPGKNTLRVVVDKLVRAADASVAVTHRQGESGGPEEKSVPAVVFAKGKVPPKLPATQEYVFEATGAPVVALWTKARSLKLDDATRKAALELFAQYYAAFVGRDVKKLEPLSKFRNSDVNHAMGWKDDPAELRAAFADLKKKSVWRPNPMAPETVSMSLVGGDQLLRLARADGSPLIKISTGSSFVEHLELFVASIDGALVIAR